MLAPVRAPAPAAQPRMRATPPPGPKGPHGWRRVRRLLVTAAVLSVIPAFVSLASAMVQPSNSSFGIRFVEWMRDNGARGVVNRIENLYYSLNAPAKGGPALHRLPGQAGALATGTATRHAVHYFR